MLASLANADRSPSQIGVTSETHNRERFTAARVIPEPHLVVSLSGSNGRDDCASFDPRLRQSMATRAFEVRHSDELSRRARYLEAINPVCVERCDGYVLAVPLDLTTLINALV